MFQGLLKSKAFISTTGALMAAYIRLVKRTSSVVEDPPGFIKNNLPDHPLIIAMWHGQGLLLPFLRPRNDIKVAVMVARHIDGDIVHATLERFGMTTIRGAGAGRKGKDKGGFAALRECMKSIRNHTTVALTADVPPGPARKAGPGLPVLSKLSGRAILPCAVVTKNHFKLNTWSGFTVFLPFSKMVIAGGEQISLPRHASDDEIEDARKRLEDSMNEVTARAFRVAGTSEHGVASDGTLSKYGPVLRAYVLSTRLMQSMAPLLLRYRERQGKEEKVRMSERMGLPSAPRLPGSLVWLHAASVGETIAILQLIDKLIDRRPDLQILLTTGTVTSARLAAERLPDGAIHQYVPLDAPDFMMRFFEHWRPAVTILTESEIWPNLIREARSRSIPLILINGRISPRSFRRWRRRIGTARPLFASLDLVLAQNDRYAGYFERLGSRNVIAAGNLKMDVPAPPADKGALQKLKQAVGKRPVFLAASTHHGEEELAAQVHKTLRKKMGDLLTIIVPRHPDRGGEICELLQARGLRVAQRTRNELPKPGHDIYVADTIGELGLFYALGSVAFIGGSLVPHGGQNPMEAIMHQTAVLSGPKVHNFEDAYTALIEAEGCIEVKDVVSLTEQVHRLLKNGKQRKRLVANAQAVIAERSGALEATLEALESYLPAKKERRRAS